MDTRIEELINCTKEKYCLDEYYLHTYEINRSTTIFKSTIYSLSMEWFPNHIKNWDDDTYNPDGTALIEIDIQSKKIKHLLFSKGISTVDGLMFDLKNRDNIIEWIEKETGLKYGRQFELQKEEERELLFKECIDGVAVSPSGYIELKMDKEGRLTFFSVNGQFPSEELVEQESYLLSLEQVEELAKEQLKLIEFPVIKKKKLIPAFAIEEIYIKNNGFSTLPYEFFVDDKSKLSMDKVIEWDKNDCIQSTFQGEILSLIETVTPDQAFQCEPHPDLRPITDEEVKKCVSSIKDFLSQEYTTDSGKWILKSLTRDKGYITSTLKAKEQKERVFKRKLKLFIDGESYQVLNYMDNEPFLKTYMEIEEAEEVQIEKEEAFKKLKDFLELSPYYVYDFEQRSYVLCGKLDCQYAVKANNGEVIELDEL